MVRVEWVYYRDVVAGRCVHALSSMFNNTEEWNPLLSLRGVLCVNLGGEAADRDLSLTEYGAFYIE